MNWTLVENKLVKTYHLPSSSEMPNRIQALNLIAGAHRHQPIFKVYGDKIKFELWTKKQNAVSNKDYTMARIIDQLFG